MKRNTVLIAGLVNPKLRLVQYAFMVTAILKCGYAVVMRKASGRTGPQALLQCSQYVVTVCSTAQTRQGQNDEWSLQYCHLRAAEECKTRGRERDAFALRMSATEEIPPVDGTRACER